MGSTQFAVRRVGYVPSRFSHAEKATEAETVHAAALGDHANRLHRLG